MKLTDQITLSWQLFKAARLASIQEDPYGEYSRLDRLDGLNKKDLP